MKALASVAVDASMLVTTMVAAPAAWAGVVAVIVVSLTIPIPLAAVAPMVTVAPVWNPLPVMVTLVPPKVEPLVGAIPEMVTMVTLEAAEEGVAVTIARENVTASDTTVNRRHDIPRGL